MTKKTLRLPKATCEQPDCALKRARMNVPRVAEILVRALSKEDSIDRLREHERITPRGACVECASRVVRGLQPLMTIAEHERQAQNTSDSPEKHLRG
ncbi:MAG: hypothetical protein ACI9QQ_000914 [Myxococcota bacterium]|jgi:hypothetical protein